MCEFLKFKHKNKHIYIYIYWYIYIYIDNWWKTLSYKNNLMFDLKFSEIQIITYQADFWHNKT